ncbi:MAG TPA: UDP-4-amino-4,6-dideoxy-N-acetyl-beta-L-altrosamine transaminase [Allosphingosinicella sp.]|nr:UDP-4-amino-4,6-dideoxy-N-acetyl-beta-L-altrosamine transaminase [Allosphingosinicella sp.]
MSRSDPPFLSYGRQHITDADVAAVAEVLRSDFLTQGPAVPRFEAALQALTGAPHVFAMANATAALHLSCLACDVGPGDVVWTSPNSFVASANCALYCGADADFVDIDPATFNMSADALEAKLAAAEAAGGRLPKVVIPVHFAGQPCDMGRIGALARRYGFRVIEDASHAVGAMLGNTPIGGCADSDIAVFSFHPVKIVTTGEGGAAMTRDPVLAERLELLRSHGVTRREDLMSGPPEGPWYYEQVALGFNYRMTDIQAALGASQLERLEGYLRRRHELGALYDERLAGLPLTTPLRVGGRFSAFHLYVIQLDDPALRRPVFEALRGANIGANVHYIPIHLQPYYRALGFGPGDFPNAEAYYARAITLPLHPQMSDGDVDRVADCLREALA